MTPSSSDTTFWAHIPAWMWPILLAGILGFFLFEAIKASEAVAKLLGPIGRRIHSSVSPRRLENKLDRIEAALDAANDKLDCSMTYLAFDAMWHADADIIIAENHPNLLSLLPARMSFTDFSRQWRAGWRPSLEDGLCA